MARDVRQIEVEQDHVRLHAARQLEPARPALGAHELDVAAAREDLLGELAVGLVVLDVEQAVRRLLGQELRADGRVELLGGAPRYGRAVQLEREPGTALKIALKSATGCSLARTTTSRSDTRACRKGLEIIVVLKPCRRTTDANGMAALTRTQAH